MEGKNKINIQIGENVLTATLVENSSAEALFAMLEAGLLTIHMNDYAGMEKVGSIGKLLPTNDQHIKAKPCDLILYLGDSLVIYYESNSWNFTRLGRIEGVTQKELKMILVRGDVTAVLTPAEKETN